ncbi:MAG: tetratricopeptide repeat protein, partial [Thiohalocapsa sp.]
LRLLAQAHVLRDETALAQDALEKAIETAPKASASYLQLAALRSKAGDADGASQVLERLLATVPEDATAQTALARLQLGQQDIGALEKTAEQVLRSRPEHPLGYYLNGVVLQRKGDLQESIEQFETALAKNPKAVEPLVALARSFLALDQPEEAQARLEELLADSPNNVVAMNLLAEVYGRMGKQEDARRQYASAIERAPGSPMAYQRLAQLQAADGEQDKAIATLESGLDPTQRNGTLLLTLGMVKQQAGEDQGAIKAYEEVVERFPTADVAANNLTMLLVGRGADNADDLARARALAERLAESNQAAFLDTAGWVQYLSGNYESAVSLLEKARGLADPTPQRQYHLGMTYLKVGRTDEGRRLLASAVEADSPFPGIEQARAVLKSD